MEGFCLARSGRGLRLGGRGIARKAAICIPPLEGAFCALPCRHRKCHGKEDAGACVRNDRHGPRLGCAECRHYLCHQCLGERKVG